MAFGRLLMRLLLVPLGFGIAIVAAMMFVMVAEWNRVGQLNHDDISGLTAFFVIVPMMALTSAVTLLPGVVTALIAEAFAIRSWIYHAACGGAAAWVGLVTLGPLDAEYDFTNTPLVMIGAGIAAGFAYWLVAGWSAGFWKPVFASPPAPPSPPVAPET
jgi:hypothetical protein